ncbi:MAG: tyrosine-type recombinase/integrase, partial [Rhodoglobus sp.]
FLALKRATGRAYLSEQNHLLRFDGFVRVHAVAPPLGRETMHAYLSSLTHLSGRARDNVLGVVWPALDYARAHGEAVDVLPARPARAPTWNRQRAPRILSHDEIVLLQNGARALSTRCGRQPSTYATLFGVLAVTGMRISEALALDVQDLDLTNRIVSIRHGKFGKARDLPLRPSTVQALRRHLEDPARTVGCRPAAPVFVSNRGRRLGYAGAQVAFRQACRTAQLEPRPRFHDLRHTFAVRRVLAWYAAGDDVNAWLPALSTYLGHISVEHTRLYLRANGLLFEQAALRFDALARCLDRGVLR